jgi:predicted alpha/beta-fold hydrolase
MDGGISLQRIWNYVCVRSYRVTRDGASESTVLRIRCFAFGGSYSLSRAFTRLFIYRIASIIDAMKAEYVELNDIQMYYEMEGTGEPLLLLHGGTGCQEDWIYAGRDQFMAEYTIIKPDARGHGRTSNSQRTITHRQCALDTLALLDRLEIRTCRAIGLSMGGNILLHMATFATRAN